MPREVHEHHDAEGNLTGYTVVVRETRVTDDDRAQMLALDEHERGLCSCGCGQPFDEATDAKRAFKIDTVKCQARRALEIRRRADKEKAEKVKRPVGWDDGLTYFIEDSFVPEQMGGVSGNS